MTQKSTEEDQLTLLVDYCERRMATVGGDGYSEIVLYRNEADGSCQLHTYEKYEYMDKEIHIAYTTEEETVQEIFDLIKQENIQQYVGKSHGGLCGGMVILKFVQKGEVTRITTDNLPMEKINSLYKIGTFIKSKIGKVIPQ